MAELDEKTQKIVDREVKKARKDVLKTVNEQIASAADDNKSTEDKGAKKAVADVLKSLKTGIKDATAE